MGKRALANRSANRLVDARRLACQLALIALGLQTAAAFASAPRIKAQALGLGIPGAQPTPQRPDPRNEGVPLAQRAGPALGIGNADALSAAHAGRNVGARSDSSELYEWQLPRGFPVPAVPADNPMSVSKVALGQRLFFETRLSVTGRYSCASCHDPSRAFTDGRATAIGATGESLPLSAMSLANVAYNVSFGWNQPTVRSLEAQMREPLLSEHPIELGLQGRESEVLSELRADASYQQAFATAFPGDGDPISLDHLIKAIASYERTLIFGNSAFDRYVFGGDHTALSEEAKRGMVMFFSKAAGCSSCHSGFNFSGSWRDEQGDTGEPTFASNGVTAQPMRVPTLRNISLTAPYMHDGRFATLQEVLEHYKISDKRELIAFLESLTADR